MISCPMIHTVNICLSLWLPGVMFREILIFFYMPSKKQKKNNRNTSHHWKGELNVHVLDMNIITFLTILLIIQYIIIMNLRRAIFMLTLAPFQSPYNDK